MDGPDFPVRAVYELVSKYEAETSQKLSFSYSDRLSLKFIVAAILLSALSGITFVSSNNTSVHVFGSLLFVSAVLLYYAGLGILVFANVTEIKAVLSNLFHPFGTASTTLASTVERDYEFTDRLNNFHDDLLKFIAKRMHTQAEAMRFRVSLLVGPIEKVGILPSLIGFGLQVWSRLPESQAGKSPVDPWMLFIVSFILLVLNFFGLFRLVASRRLDELADIVHCAAERKTA